MANCRRDTNLARTVDYSADDDEDEDDDDEDDLDDDGDYSYDALTDFDELEYQTEFGKNDSYGNAHLGLDYVGNRLNTKYNSHARRHRSISEGCPRVLEHADDNRRDHHNHLERKRRASIKGSYNELREAIPGLRGSKASRAVTLQKAVEYIEELTKRNREHTRCVDKLTRQNELLDRQIYDLSRTCQLLEESDYSAPTYPDRNSATIGQPTNNAGLNIRFVTATPGRNSISCLSNESLPVFRLVSHALSKSASAVQQSQPSTNIDFTMKSGQQDEENLKKMSSSSPDNNLLSSSRRASRVTPISTLKSARNPVPEKVAIPNHSSLVPASIQNISISALRRSHESVSPIADFPKSKKKKVYATLDDSTPIKECNLQSIRNNEKLSPETSTISAPVNKYLCNTSLASSHDSNVSHEPNVSNIPSAEK